jgi:hypothetical protein
MLSGPPRGRAALAAAVALVAGIVVNLVAYAPPALANPACQTYRPNFASWTWTPSSNDVAGVRAPILIRTDGELCSGGNQTFITAWIGIQDQHSNGITQIGYDRHFNSSGTAEHCRFWAIGTGSPHYYDCETDANDTFVFFRIEQYRANDGQLYYNVEDCGTEGDFNNCTIKSGTQPVYLAPQGSVASEVNYGDVQDGCPEQMLGSSSDPVLYGNSSWGLRGKNSSGWAARSWAAGPTNGCSTDYRGATTSDGVKTWDSRNTS